MAIYVDSPKPTSAEMRAALTFFADVERRVENQRIFDAVKHGANVRIVKSDDPRFINSESANEGTSR